MKRAACIALLSVLVAFSAFAQSPNWSAGVVYEYDGSGNVKKIGTDSYVYDTAQRLIRGSVAGSQQSYTYDSFGNRTGCTPGVPGDCQYGLTIDSETNRIEDLSHDKRGNLLRLPEGNSLEYDELGMVRKETGTNRAVYYIYTADDERIAVYDADTQTNVHHWRWTVRGLDKKPLREFTSDNSVAGKPGVGNFKWFKDHIWRDSVLLASRQIDSTTPSGVSTYHYHVDHLGTPRRITNTSSEIIGQHDYLPFGPEITTTIAEPQTQTLKFTGHERDFVRDRPPLDYMHARYYEGRVGRFLSVDPTWESADLGKPQSWNRYSYVLNNPVNLTDPDGKCPFCVQVLKELAVDFVVDGSPTGSADLPKDPAQRAAYAREMQQWRLEQRAKEIHSALTPDTQRRTTTAVAEVTNPDGTKQIIVAFSEKKLRPAQIAALRAGETAVEGVGHAEQTIINAAAANGQKVEAVAASRPICPSCATGIRAAGARAVSALKKLAKEIIY